MKIAFAGTPHFGALVLGALLRSRHEVALVITQPDRPAGRGRALRESPVKKLALREGLRIAQPDKISTPDFVDEMKAAGIKVLTVAAFGQILKPPLLGGMPCINVHGSLLPKYRGAAPIERAIMAGERVTGVTIMDITPKVDTGAIYLQRVIPIGDGDDAGSMYEKLGRAGGEALAEVLDAMEGGGMEPEPQDENAATYVEKITPADTEIVWERPAWKISAQIRALSPHIGAYTNAGGHRLKLWKARVAEPAAVQAEGALTQVGAVEEADASTSAIWEQSPGTIIVTGGRLFVICGTGILELMEVQPEGKKHLSEEEFLRGYTRLLAGGRLTR